MKKRNEFQVTSIYYVMTLMILAMIVIFALSMMDINYFISSYKSFSKDVNEWIYKGQVDAEYDEDLECLIVEMDLTNIGIHIIEETFINSHIKYRKVTDLDAVGKEVIENIGFILISGSFLNDQANREEIFDLVRSGKDVLITSMPDSEALEDRNLREIMGIKAVDGSKPLENLRFLDGFMLGGLLEFADIDSQFMEVDLLSSTKKFVDDGKEVPVIWRNVFGKSQIFVVNGQLFESKVGYGVLSGIMSEVFIDYIYPVINSVVYTYNGLPYLSNENTDTLEAIYNRDALLLQEDILLPDIIAFNKVRGMIPTAIVSYGFHEKNEINMDTDIVNRLENYKKDLYKLNGTFALFYNNAYEINESDFDQISHILPISAIYEPSDGLISLDLLSQVNIILKPWSIKENNFKVDAEDNIYIPITYSTLLEDTKSKMDLYAMATAYGLISHNLDIEEIIYPNDERHNWINISKVYLDFIDQYRVKMADFVNRDIVETSKIIHQFKTADIVVYYGSDRIEVVIDNLKGEMDFILRTNKGIVSISSGFYKEIEANVYLITLDNPTSVIELEQINLFE